MIIDPANDKVLYTSPGHQFGMGGFAMGQRPVMHGQWDLMHGIHKRLHLEAQHHHLASQLQADLNPNPKFFFYFFIYLSHVYDQQVNNVKT